MESLHGSGCVPELHRVRGPTGMAPFRNVQVSWMPLKGNSNLVIAAERPGASGDQGVANRVELSDIQARFPMPDITGAYNAREGLGLRARPARCA